MSAESEEREGRDFVDSLAEWRVGDDKEAVSEDDEEENDDGGGGGGGGAQTATGRSSTVGARKVDGLNPRSTVG